MRIASAQITSTVGDTQHNIQSHLDLIKISTQNKVDVIVFPEMSLTGYCREEGKKLALTPSDDQLVILKKAAKDHKLIIIAGAPFKVGDQLFIASFIFKPDGETDVYTKQYLHQGEEQFYSSSFDYNPIIKIGDEVMCFAICADIDHKQHAIEAKRNGCTLYVASLFFTINGINQGAKQLSSYARELSFSVLMSNYTGKVWNFEGGGKSGFWNDQGVSLVELETNVSGLVILDKIKNSWVVEKVELV